MFFILTKSTRLNCMASFLIRCFPFMIYLLCKSTRAVESMWFILVWVYFINIPLNIFIFHDLPWKMLIANAYNREEKLLIWIQNNQWRAQKFSQGEGADVSRPAPLCTPDYILNTFTVTPKTQTLPFYLSF